MYICPQPYMCEKCSFECSYGPHDSHPSPVLEIRTVINNGSYHSDMVPTCPKCWEKWVKKEIGIMKRKE